MNLNWINLIANASVTLFMLSVAGWLFRRWVIHVDEGIKASMDASHRIEISLANLPKMYTIKDDFNTQKDHCSGRNKDLRLDLKVLEKDHEQRITVMETLLKIKGPS